MVDNGFVFEGPHWQLNDSPLQGLYFRPMVYRGVRGLDDFQPWLDRIVHFPGGGGRPGAEADPAGLAGRG